MGPMTAPPTPPQASDAELVQRALDARYRRLYPLDCGWVSFAVPAEVMYMPRAVDGPDGYTWRLTGFLNRRPVEEDIATYEREGLL